jgi:hypothetical protein
MKRPRVRIACHRENQVRAAFLRGTTIPRCGLGEFWDAKGRLIPTLLDSRGKPYPTVVAECLLHEELEATSLMHDGISEVSTKTLRPRRAPRANDFRRSV